MLTAEYSTTVVPVEQAEVSYLTADHLGSPRIVTDRNAQVSSRKDFTAFGETVSSSHRTSGPMGNGYDQPNVRQDYTGYQKDNESQLEFAQARYFNAQHGRFTSVDPLTASAAIKNPQTFNRYSYALNTPYKFTDPLGLMAGGCGADRSRCDGEPSGSTGNIDSALGRHDQLLQQAFRALELQRQAQDASNRGYDAMWDIIDNSGGLIDAEPSVTVEASTVEPASWDPFVISNAEAFFSGLATNSGYQDGAGISQCALLPLGWENSQDSYMDKAQRDSKKRMTPNWTQGEQVADNMALAQGTVLASGWVNGSYTSKPAGTQDGNHVVVFDSFGTENGKRGMFVAEQLADRGGPVRSFKPFDPAGGYFGNAGGFSVVRIIRPRTESLKINNTDRRTLMSN